MEPRPTSAPKMAIAASLPAVSAGMASVSRANGASQAGILTSSTAMETGTDFTEAGVGLVSGKGATGEGDFTSGCES